MLEVESVLSDLTLDLGRDLSLSSVLSFLHVFLFLSPLSSVFSLLLCPPSVLSAFFCLSLSLALCPVMPCFVKIKKITKDAASWSVFPVGLFFMSEFI